MKNKIFPTIIIIAAQLISINALAQSFDPINNIEWIDSKEISPREFDKRADFFVNYSSHFENLIIARINIIDKYEERDGIRCEINYVAEIIDKYYGDSQCDTVEFVGSSFVYMTEPGDISTLAWMKSRHPVIYIGDQLVARIQDCGSQRPLRLNKRCLCDLFFVRPDSNDAYCQLYVQKNIHSSMPEPDAKYDDLNQLIFVEREHIGLLDSLVKLISNGNFKQFK